MQFEEVARLSERVRPALLPLALTNSSKHGLACNCIDEDAYINTYLVNIRTKICLSSVSGGRGEVCLYGKG